jgi:drug/metabolite transporter (DMT)-like permease
LNKRPYIDVILSAALFGLSAPLSKLLLRDIAPVALAGLLYGGAFLGLSFYALGTRWIGPGRARAGAKLFKKDIPWLAGAILTGGIGGPICLLLGLARISGTSASLLLNLEGVATALVAVLIFRESAGRRIWAALGLMTCAGVFLSWDPGRGRFEIAGSLLVLAAMVCWGLDNNFTRNIADRDPVLIARIKGLVSAGVSLGLALLLGLRIPLDAALLGALALGAFSYGISLVLYIRALAHLGAFRAGAFFSFAPFIGAIVSLAVLPEPARWILAPGAALMALGVYLLVGENHEHLHRHERLVHAHAHGHRDGHHRHVHDEAPAGPHVHEHQHDEIDHAHGHWPDAHHRHGHGANPRRSAHDRE